jgi:RNA polymerase sigma factor (sigma-70 family)
VKAGALRDVLLDLRRVASQDPSGIADSELLRRYAGNRDEAAFELLVWRHADMVLGVCRRVLGHAQDAEDAFQATWLALARRARCVGRRGSVGGWLYRVAYRVALRLRARNDRRTSCEQAWEEVATSAGDADPSTAAAWQELKQVLDEQLDRLPERYRAAFVLCCLSGRSGSEAARELGCAVGTVASRLARARAHLRRALVRRGFAVSAGLVAAGWPLDGLAGQAPPALVAAAVRAVLGSVAASAEVVALAESTLRSIVMTRLKMATAVAFIVFALFGVGTAQFGVDAGEKAANPPPPTQETVAERLTRLVSAGELDGDWLLERAEIGGKENAELGWLKNELRWVFRGNYLTIQRFGQSSIGTCKLEGKKEPREIDIQLVEGPVPGERVYRGIYKREEVRLTICYAPVGVDRPTAFETKPGSPAMLAVFRWTEGRGQNPFDPNLQGTRNITPGTRNPYTPGSKSDKPAAPPSKKEGGAAPDTRNPYLNLGAGLTAPQLLNPDSTMSPALVYPSSSTLNTTFVAPEMLKPVQLTPSTLVPLIFTQPPPGWVDPYLAPNNQAPYERTRVDNSKDA